MNKSYISMELAEKYGSKAVFIRHEIFKQSMTSIIDKENLNDNDLLLLHIEAIFYTLMLEKYGYEKPNDLVTKDFLNKVRPEAVAIFNELNNGDYLVELDNLVPNKI